MTRKVAGLNAAAEEELVEINPVLAAGAGHLRRGDGEGSLSPGEVATRARVTESCPPGVVSMTFHFAESPDQRAHQPGPGPAVEDPRTEGRAVRIEKLEA